MKTSKITLMIMGFALASLFASCKKTDNNNNGAVVGMGFRAHTELEADNGSRTHGVADGNGIAVQWTAGDQILVANQGGTGNTLTYNLKEGIDSTEGRFTSSNEDDEFLQPDYVAIYPASNTEGVANDINGTTATFHLPATQNYLENSFAEKAMPMVAYSSEQSLQFKNVLGGICFPIVGGGKTVTKIVLTSKTDEVLWGECTTTISSTSGEPTSTVSNEETTKNIITLDCGTGVALDADEPTDFYIMVPAGTLGSGFVVEAYDGEDKIWEESADWTASPVANFIPRSVIRKVETNLDAIVPVTVSPTFITINSAKAIGMVDGTPLECGILYAKASDLAAMGGTPASQLVVNNTDSRIHKVPATTVTSQFEVDLTGLAANTVYYVRAYANNNLGIMIPFATRRNYFADDDGNQGMMRRRISDGDSSNDPFLFSTADTRKVGFSMGNLQYNAVLGTHNVNTSPITTELGTWRFAECQFDVVGDNPGNTDPSATQSGWIDLFGYGTSGWQSSAPCWRPYDTNYGNGSPNQSALYSPTGNFYANFLNSLTGPYANSDWGVYNAISNGGNTPNQWRTWQGYNYEDAEHPEYGVHYDETENLFTRDDLSGRETYRFLLTTMTKQGDASMSVSVLNGHMACGTTIGGAIVFPDNFSWPTDYLSVFEAVNVFGSGAEITEAQWSLLEQQGAIFLPAGGYRRGGVSAAGLYGYYNSATVTNWSAVNSMTIGFGSAQNWLHWSNAYRFTGRSVRVVRTIEE